MIIKWIYQLFRPTKSKLILLIPFYISSIILKYFFVIVMFSAKSLGLGDLVAILSLYLMKITAAGSAFVLWLDPLFYVTDGKGSIISRPEIMLLILKYKFILDIVWIYFLTCFIHRFFIGPKENKVPQEVQL